MTGTEETREGLSIGRRALWTLVGAIVGAAVALGLWLLLYRADFVLPRAAERLTLGGAGLVTWLVVLGAAAFGWGREAARAFEAVLLPEGLSQGARRLYLGALIVALLAVVQYITDFLLRDPTDLPSFLLAARTLMAGEDFYNPGVIASMTDHTTEHRVIFPYLYLPLFAILNVPLSYLPQATAHGVVLVFNALLWLLLLYLTLRLLEVPDHLRGPCAALVIFLIPTFLPALQTLHHGSPSLLVAVLVVAVLVLEREDRHRWSGALLALVVLIKIVPVFLVGYLLLRRRFRAVLWALAVGLALLLLSVAVAGVGPHLHWLTEMAPSLSYGARTGTFFEPGCHAENQALTGVFCRFLGARDPSARLLASITGGVVVLLAALAILLRRRGPIDRLEGSLVAVTILLVSTITWFHHMTLMILPILTLIVEGAEGRRRPILACGLIALAAIGFSHYLDPWPFVSPNPVTRTIRFQAMALTYIALVALVIRARWGGVEAETAEAPEAT